MERWKMDEVEQRYSFIGDIITTAIEGGIDYWAIVHKATMYNCRVILFESEAYDEESPSENNKITVGYRDINKAIKKIIETKELVAKEYETELFYADKYNDSSEIDSVLADIIFQVAVFGEVVYG